jgi:hypothetical protein
LANIDHQDSDCAAVADETQHHGAIEDRAEFGSFEDVDEKPGEERAGAESDNSQIKKDPEPECETIVHIGLIQTVAKAEPRGIDSQREECGPGGKPDRKSGE